MKTFHIIVAALMISTHSFALVRNVSNAPNAPVNAPHAYNDLQTSINDCQDNDTIYLHGTNVSYGNVTIDNKQLVIIGAGFGSNLQNSSNLATIVGVINFVNYAGVKNVSLIGLRMEEPKCGTSATNLINTLYVERCGIKPSLNGSVRLRCNTLFLKQSVFGDHTYDYADDFFPAAATAYISNCVLQGVFRGDGIAAAVFENNIFKRSYSGSHSGYSEIKSMNGSAVFNNNVFFANYGVSVSNCTFNNNLFESISSLPSSNTGSNNIFGVPAGLLSSPNQDGMLARANFSTSVNYRLSPTSPCIGAGVNGTNIGVYGGTNPIPTVNEINGVPSLPRITQMTIQNMSVAPGGNLNVNIKAVNQQ